MQLCTGQPHLLSGELRSTRRCTSELDRSYRLCDLGKMEGKITRDMRVSHIVCSRLGNDRSVAKEWIFFLNERDCGFVPRDDDGFTPTHGVFLGRCPKAHPHSVYLALYPESIGTQSHLHQISATYQ